MEILPYGIHADVCQRFTVLMDAAGLQELPAEKAIPLHDDSLLFTNATTVIFKPYFLQERVISTGAFAIQPCLRFQSLQAYEQNPQGEEHYNLYFTMLGGFVPVDSPVNIFELLYSMLLDTFSFSKEQIDIHLEDSAERYFHGLEVLNKASFVYNQREHKFYNWRYGMDGVSGRGVSYVCRMVDGREENLGQVIAVFNGDVHVGYEFGFGVETLLYGRYCAPSVLYCSKQMESVSIVPSSSAMNQLVDVMMAAVVILTSSHRVYETNERQGSLFNRLVRHMVRLTMFEHVSREDILHTSKVLSAYVGLSDDVQKSFTDYVLQKIVDYTRHAQMAQAKQQELIRDMQAGVYGRKKARKAMQTFIINHPILPEQQQQLLAAFENF